MRLSQAELESWFEKAKHHGFGIILPDGWLGRPYDSIFRLTAVTFTENEILITFQQCRSLLIKNARSSSFSPSKKDTYLVFKDFEELRLEWVDFGDEKKVPLPSQVNRFTGGELRLVGYFK